MDDKEDRFNGIPVTGWESDATWVHRGVWIERAAGQLDTASLTCLFGGVEVCKVSGIAWNRIVLAVFASGIVCSMTDWFFMGDWLYKRYDKHPEIWRYPGGQEETRAIVFASLLPFLTCGVFIFACALLHLTSYNATLKVALAVWLIGPLPLTIANSLFMKLTPAIATAHALGWSVKLVLAGLAASLFLG